MNAFRKWIGFLNGLMLVMLTITATGFAVPASAAVDKQFALSVEAFPDYTVLPASTPGSEVKAPVKVIATFTNLSPPSTASSNVGSLTLSMTVPGMSIVNGLIGGTDYSPTGTSGNVVRTSADVDHRDEHVAAEGAAEIHAHAVRQQLRRHYVDRHGEHRARSSPVSRSS